MSQPPADCVGPQPLASLLAAQVASPFPARRHRSLGVECCAAVWSHWTRGGSDEALLAEAVAGGGLEALRAFAEARAEADAADDGALPRPPVLRRFYSPPSRLEFLPCLLAQQPAVLPLRADEPLLARIGSWVTPAGTPDVHALAAAFPADTRVAVHACLEAGAPRSVSTLAAYCRWWAERRPGEPPAPLLYMKDLQLVACAPPGAPPYVPPSPFVPDWLGDLCDAGAGRDYRFVYLGASLLLCVCVFEGLRGRAGYG